MYLSVTSFNLSVESKTESFPLKKSVSFLTPEKRLSFFFVFCLYLVLRLNRQLASIQGKEEEKKKQQKEQKIINQVEAKTFFALFLDPEIDISSFVCFQNKGKKIF